MRFLLTLLFVPSFAFANVTTWVEQFKQDAANQGISQLLLDEAFEGFTPIHKVIALDRKQPESTMTAAEYWQKVVPQSRIDRARNEYAQNQTAVDAAASRYGVNPEVIVALWGIESNFGERQGNFEIVDALATLAYEGRRAAYFRKELINALKIIDQGHISLHDMVGSWAGAMGQCQFMPSSFLSYAKDGNGDGRKDIWNTSEDVYASIANYLSSVGWDATQPVALPVELPNSFDTDSHGGNTFHAYSQWQALGLEVDAHPLLSQTTALKLVKVGKGNGSRYVLATRNFDTLMAWNRSTYFGSAVAKLSAAI